MSKNYRPQLVQYFCWDCDHRDEPDEHSMCWECGGPKSPLGTDHTNNCSKWRPAS